MTHKSYRSAAIVAFTLAAGAGQALASGPAEEALLVIDPSSPASLYVGNYYKEARAIPDENVLYMDPAAANYADFAAINLDGLFGTLANRELEETVDYVILTPGAPFYLDAVGYVNDNCSPVRRFALPSAYTMAFLTDRVLGGTGVQLRNGYYDSTAIPAFDSNIAWDFGEPDVDGDRYFIGAMLGYDGQRGNTLAEIIDMIDRSVAVDGTRPQGAFYFMDNPSDPARNVRSGQYADTANDIIDFGGDAEVLNGVLPLGRQDCLGVMTGAAGPDVDGGDYTLLDGAFGDHLTSWAGTFDNGQQTKMSEWITKGASGSVGAVEEPCNYTGKFPHADLHLHYYYGATLGEAYFRAAQFVPFQMLFLGDPLTRPFVYLPTITLFNEPTGPVAGTVEFIVLAETSNPIAQMDRLEVTVDGDVVQTIDGAGGVVSIDTTTLTDGYHDLRLFAIDNSALQMTSRQQLDLIVDNSGESATLDVTTASGDLSTRFRFDYDVQASDIVEVQLRQNGRVLASSGNLTGSFWTFGQTLGAGPATVQLHALRTDGEIVRSEPLALDIAFDPGTPTGNPPIAYGYSRTVLADQPFVLELPGTFSDDPSAATFNVLVPPTQATIHPGATGGYRILVPDPGATGTDQLTYNVSAPSGTSANATITWTYHTGATLPGDLNGDGCVDQADLGILLASYGVDDGGDLDGDGETGQADLGILLSNYLVGC